MKPQKQPPKQQTSQKTKLEKQYEELFGPSPRWSEVSDNYSLAQPSPFKTVPTVVTYGVYEEPI